MVLVLPAVLALLGDNPMQSELACHVGLAGKFFCRNCWVKGRDAEEAESAPAPQTTHPASDAESVGSARSGESETDTSKSRTQRKETMQELVDRARRFLDVGTYHSLI